MPMDGGGCSYTRSEQQGHPWGTVLKRPSGIGNNRFVRSIAGRNEVSRDSDSRRLSQSIFTRDR